MINHHSSESVKFSGSIVDPENAEDLERTKIDIENNITKILKLIKNEDQSKNNKNSKRSRKEKELVGLIEDLSKHYQSLYALCDRLSEEFEKVVSRRRKRRTSESSSDSDSESEEYFSSEEVDGNNRRPKKELLNVSDTTNIDNDTEANMDEVLMTEGSAEAKESEEQLNSQMKEIESLSQQKRNPELQAESHANEVEQLSAKNTELHDRVIELELLLKEKKGEVSTLQGKLENNENQAKSNIAELMAQVNKLTREAKSLRTQKDEMEEKIEVDKTEALSQRKELMDQLNVMQQNLNSLCNQNKELEAQMEREKEQVSQYMSQIENLKENLAETMSVQQSMVEEKELFLARIKELELVLEAQSSQKNELVSQFQCQIENLKENLAETSTVQQSMVEEKELFLARIKDQELELETRSNQKNELEEQLRDRSFENKQLADENKALQDRNHELKRALTQKGEEISAFLREPENQENGASMQAMAYEAEVNSLRLELDTLHEQKRKLEQQNEQSEKEYAESLAKMEDLNKKLTSQIADHEKNKKDDAATIERITAEHKQTKALSNKLKLNRQTTERKMEEMAEEIRKKMEGNIRLLHQRIHVAEQLNNENKSSCNMIKERYEQENKMLGKKVASYEEELRTLRENASLSRVGDGARNGLDLEALKQFQMDALNGLDLTAAKVEEHKNCMMSRVFKMLGEVRFAKDWMKKMNDEMKQKKDKVDSLTALLNSKEEQEFLLREKVWELEAKVSKEGGEKLNLTNAVSQLEKKVGKLEKSLKEKDEDLVSLGENKREAIRQLCFVVNFHRDRCNYLKDLVIKMGVHNKTTT